MFIERGAVGTLGGEMPRGTFGEEPKRPGAWAGRRLMLLDEKPAYELSLWCGSCEFLFKRLEGANDTVAVEALRDLLAEGLEGIDGPGENVVADFGRLLGAGEYLPLLLSVWPRPVRPAEPGDYFAEEQLATWGVEDFWGLPVYPATAYYRTFETAVSADAHLYEFVVPMVSPVWFDRPTLDRYTRELAESSAPPPGAGCTQDVCAPAGTRGFDYYQHWGLTHFLLDGHHKVHAAAQAGRPVRLLSLLSVDSSLASSEQIGRLPQLRSQPSAPCEST